MYSLDLFRYSAVLRSRLSLLELICLRAGLPNSGSSLASLLLDLTLIIV